TPPLPKPGEDISSASYASGSVLTSHKHISPTRYSRYSLCGYAATAYNAAAMTPPSRLILPAPGPEPRETPRGRLRCESRSKALRFIGRCILALRRSASWLDRHAPLERRYFRVAIFGSSRIQAEDEIYPRVKELARRLSYLGRDIVTGGGPGL